MSYFSNTSTRKWLAELILLLSNNLRLVSTEKKLKHFFTFKKRLLVN